MVATGRPIGHPDGMEDDADPWAGLGPDAASQEPWPAVPIVLDDLLAERAEAVLVAAFRRAEERRRLAPCREAEEQASLILEAATREADRILGRQA